MVPLHSQHPRVRIVSGAYIRNVPNVHLYTTTAPIFFDITYNTTPVAPPTNLSSTCNSEDFKTFHTVGECPLTDAMNTRFEHLHNRLSQINDIFTSHIFNQSTPTRVPRSLASDIALQSIPSINDSPGNTRLSDYSLNPFSYIGQVASWCCGYASHKDVEGLFTNVDRIDKYMNVVKDSVITDHQNILTMKRAYQNITLNLNDRFVTVKQEVTSALLQADQEFEYLANRQNRGQMIDYEVLQYLTWFSELLALQDLVDYCRSGLIPLIYVSPANLVTQLHQLQQTAADFGHELVIPISQISSYYKLQLADCQFAENRVLIQIRVPLRPKQQVWSLFDTVNIPFKFDNNICSLSHSPTYIAASPPIYVPISGVQLSECNPKESLCLVPQFNTDPLLGSLCPQRIIQGASVRDLKEVCAFDCRPIKANQAVITQLDYHHFIITDAPIGTTVNCNSRTNSTSTILSPPAAGALEIILPCHCSVTIPNSRPINPIFPYPFEQLPFPLIHIVIPSEWSNIDSYIQSRRQQPSTLATFTSLSDCLNSSWTIDTPVLNITNIDELTNFKIPKLIHQVSASTNWFMLIWNFLLTLVILFLCYLQCRPRFGGAIFSALPLVNPASASPFFTNFTIITPPKTAALTDHDIEHQLTLTTVTLVLADLVLLLLCAGFLYLCFRRQFHTVPLPRARYNALNNTVRFSPTPTPRPRASTSDLTPPTVCSAYQDAEGNVRYGVTRLSTSELAALDQSKGSQRRSSTVSLNH